MKYLIIILLIGIVLYYAFKWQSSPRKTRNNSRFSGNPYQDDAKKEFKDSGRDRSDPYQSQGRHTRQAGRGSSYGKWVGGGLGWAFGGPIGGILGFMFGSMFDGMSNGQYEYGKTQSGDFNISLLVLTAAVMKADGSVKRSELDYVKQYFYTNFGQEHGSQYIRMLGEIIKQDINVKDVSSQIGRYMDYSSKLLLLQYLFGIALADNRHHPAEVSLIQSIAGFMGVGSKDYESIKAMFIKDSGSAYRILEIEPDATDEQIKKAYRDLAKRYHPDKVSHLGEDVKLAAEQKFTKLNTAYDTIKQERGMV